MKGNIRKRGNGWQLTIWTGQKANGKPTRYYETVKGTKAEPCARRSRA